MERVKTYMYKVVVELPQSPNWSKYEKSKGAYSNLWQYFTAELALAAGLQAACTSAVSVLIIEHLATLPLHQIRQLKHGLPWSSEIDLSEINLELCQTHEHPISR